MATTAGTVTVEEQRDEALLDDGSNRTPTSGGSMKPG